MIAHNKRGGRSQPESRGMAKTERGDTPIEAGTQCGDRWGLQREATQTRKVQARYRNCGGLQRGAVHAHSDGSLARPDAKRRTLFFLTLIQLAAKGSVNNAPSIPQPDRKAAPTGGVRSERPRAGFKSVGPKLKSFGYGMVHGERAKTPPELMRHMH